MSEYQYYEFQAVDRALNSAEQGEVAKLSSRVDISPHRAVFTYDFGDFRGNPVKLLSKYFDAMLYVASWGSRWLYFRMPASLVRLQDLKPYCAEDLIKISTSEHHIIVGIEFDEEGGSGWLQPEGELDELLPVRQRLLEGDYRALYLAWLKANEYAEDAADEGLEPPVPPGLRTLSPPLKAFADFFEINDDLLIVAAESSAEIPSETDLDGFVSELSPEEQQDFLRRFTRGESDAAGRLRLRLTEIARQERPGLLSKPSEPRRRVSELLERTAAREHERAERDRQAREAARLRQLESLAKEEPQLWHQVDSLFAQKQTKAYDQAVEILKQLKDLAQHRQQLDPFLDRIRAIQQQYRTRPGLLARLQEAGLTLV